MENTSLEAALGEPERVETDVKPEQAEQPAPEAEQPEAEAEAPEQPEQPQEPAEPEPEKPDALAGVMAALSEAREANREMRERLARIEQQERPKPEAPKAPDMFADPEGYTRFMQEQTQRAVESAKLDVSEASARSQFGDDVVDAAFSALVRDGRVTDAATYQRIMSERSPYHALVKWHQSAQAMAEIEKAGGVEKWREAERARIRAEVQAQNKPATVAAPPASLASETSVRPTGGGEGFAPTRLEDVIGR